MAAMAARAVWKGNISFGLENISILLFSATQKRTTDRLTNNMKMDLKS
jgi:non-homologous end joining protein Ku